MNAHSRIAFVVATLSLIGCPELIDKPLDLTCTSNDGGMPPADMAITPAKCAAAKGLSGDNLLCVDFDKITQLADPALANWNFNANMPNCWQITNGMLQVQNFRTFMGECGLTIPPIDLKAADKAQYQKVTLALVHKVDMSDPDQTAQIFLDIASPARLAHQVSGKPGFPLLLTTTITINKADLPAALMSVAKFYLKASSLGAAALRQGWQIQSVAVNGG